MALPKRRVDMVVGSPEWARETVAWAKTRWQHRQVTEEHWREALDELRAGRAWEPLGKPSLDELLKAEIGVDVKESLAILGEGRGRPKAGNSDVIRIKKERQGTTGRTYILARLRRDGHDGLLQQIEAGDLSAHAAALQVGYRKHKTTLQHLSRYWEKATVDERQQFLDWINA